jgi:hypothetical protein
MAPSKDSERGSVMSLDKLQNTRCAGLAPHILQIAYILLCRPIALVQPSLTSEYGLK